MCCNYFSQDDSYINLIHACISRTSQLNEDSVHKIEFISSKYEITVLPGPQDTLFSPKNVT